MNDQPDPAAPAARPGRRTLVPYSPDPVACAAGAVAAFALGIYLRTLMPGVGFWDTAEAQTVPYTLSIFHPTGFPTYTLLGWLWSQLPIGDVAYRMNLLSAVSLALAAGLVTLIAGHLLVERNRYLQAAAVAVAGGSFAFASEPWRNAVRADVHALHIALAALIVWLLLCWRAAVVSGSPRAGRWLAVAALTFGVSLGNHALTGLLAPAIAVWLFVVDRSIWRNWRLIGTCAVLLVAGLSVYLYIPIRAAIDPEPPLFYARPDNVERLRYLIFAEQFEGLFENFEEPLARFDAKWAKVEQVLAAQLPLVGWLAAAAGFVIVAMRGTGFAVFLLLIAVVNVFYSMNFEDGDIDRYYMTTVLAATPLLAVAAEAAAVLAARAAGPLARRIRSRRSRRLAVGGASAVVLLLALLIPTSSLLGNYARRDSSDFTDAARWVKSVYDVLPPNAVVISWWSYSTPLWYHRWVLGERPDVTIIDDRNILDDGYGTVDGAIRAFFGERPVYVVPYEPSLERLRDRWVTETVVTEAGYTNLLMIKERAT